MSRWRDNCDGSPDRSSRGRGRQNGTERRDKNSCVARKDGMMAIVSIGKSTAGRVERVANEGLVDNCVGAVLGAVCVIAESVHELSLKVARPIEEINLIIGTPLGRGVVAVIRNGARPDVHCLVHNLVDVTSECREASLVDVAEAWILSGGIGDRGTGHNAISSCGIVASAALRIGILVTILTHRI